MALTGVDDVVAKGIAGVVEPVILEWLVAGYDFVFGGVARV